MILKCVSSINVFLSGRHCAAFAQVLGLKLSFLFVFHLILIIIHHHH